MDVNSPVCGEYGCATICVWDGAEISLDTHPLKTDVYDACEAVHKNRPVSTRIPAKYRGIRA